MRLSVFAVCLLCACAGRQVVTPARTPSAEMQSCGEAREIYGRIKAQPAAYTGVRRATAEAMGERYQACSEALEAERDFNADAADANKPDGFFARAETWLTGFAGGVVFSMLVYLAVAL